MKKITVSAVALVLLLSACLAKPAETPKPESAETPTVISESSDISLEDKVGQLFMVRCDSKNMEPILEKQPGGILMFSVDFDDMSKDEVKAKIESYKKALKIEPYIAVDEEGGTVVRVSNHKALAPDKATELFDYFCDKCSELVDVETGEFGAFMKVSLLNNGPVTILLEKEYE